MCVCVGRAGREQNKQKAVELYTRAAEQGDPEGLFSLAGCYLHGTLACDARVHTQRGGRSRTCVCVRAGMGVEMDIDRALDLYGQSGKQGHASALIRLGYLYHFGMAEPGAASLSARAHAHGPLRVLTAHTHTHTHTQEERSIRVRSWRATCEGRSSATSSAR
jgi:TPR repeat protein